MKFLNLLLTLSLGYLLFSCGAAGEEFYLEPDGRGRVVGKTDLSSMWGFMQMGLQQEMANSDEERDPAQQAFFDLIMADNFDTTFSFVDFASSMGEAQGGGPTGLADIIREFESNPDLTDEQKAEMRPAIEMLGTTEMRLQGDESTGRYSVSSIQYFDQPDQARSLTEAMTNLMAMAPRDEMDEDDEQGIGMITAMAGASTQYRLDGNVLYVSRGPAPETEMEDAEMAMAMSMFSGASEDYTINLQLPGRIKKVSREAEVDKRAGRVTVTIPAAELESGFEFNIKFKPSRR